MELTWARWVLWGSVCGGAMLTGCSADDANLGSNQEPTRPGDDDVVVGEGGARGTDSEVDGGGDGEPPPSPPPTNTGNPGNQRCGNGVREADEQCDDGNDVADDECTTDCRLPLCGDGVEQAGEECDDGNFNPRDECTNNCTLAVCGDGVVKQTGANVERCDDGNFNPQDECTNNCTLAVCGDGVVKRTGANVEQCDDGFENGPFPAPCSSECRLVQCGNGVLDPGEQCDHAGENGENASCTPNCRWNGCGDAYAYLDVTPGTNNPNDLEECDDANDNNNDDCLDNCLAASCGDGYLHNQGTGSEICDEGEENGPFPAVCDSECGRVGCGNGVVEPGEECDDGNLNAETSSCLLNCMWNQCGDGYAYLDASADSQNPNELEACDDGNANDEDACTTSCRWATCGDRVLYTQGYGDAYDSFEDGNPEADNPASVEECDDGNLEDDDGCDSGCTVSGGF